MTENVQGNVCRKFAGQKLPKMCTLFCLVLIKISVQFKLLCVLMIRLDDFLVPNAMHGKFGLLFPGESEQP